MGFSLQSVDEQGRNLEEYEYLSYNASTWGEVLQLIVNTPVPARDDEAEVVDKLCWNHGDLVTPQECVWIAARLANTNRERILADEHEPERLLGLADEVQAFCERCSKRGGFEVH